MKKVENAINSGINYFDTSPYYGALKSETVLGKSLKGISREKFYVSTKCGRYGVENGTAVDSKFDFSAKTVTESVKSSLTRMSLDYFDIVYVIICIFICIFSFSNNFLIYILGP